MNPNPDRSELFTDASRGFTRREMLRLSGGGLLALGLGASPQIANAAEPAAFRFIVINDIHCRDERCHPWFEKIVAAMRPLKADFCLINGDVSESGLAEQLTAVKEIFGTLKIPLYATVGNHDYASDAGHPAFDQIFPGSVNYHFEHAGWQFLGLDSTDSRKTFFTTIQRHTFAWLDATLPALDRTKPTVICTHFPLGQGVLCRPLNTDALLKRFDGYNLRAAFSGHWHGHAERVFEHAAVTNSRCGSWWRPNMDGSPEKGFHVCDANAAGDIQHRFCVVSA